MAYYLELSVSGESLTLPLVGSYTGTIETYSGVITNISGTGQRVITGATLTQITKITATDSNGSHIYNPTVSAEAGGTLLIDEVGGNHGTLNGFSSSNPFVYYYDFLNPESEDTTADNCLVLPANRPNGEQLDLVTGANSSREFDLKVEFSQSGLSLILGATSSAAEHLAVFFGGDIIRIGMQFLNYSFTLNTNLTNYTDLITLEFNLTANTLTAKQDGVALAETFDVGTRGFKLPVEAFRTSAEINLHSISFISHDFPDDSRFYDFNRSPATAPVVPELINNQNGTILGGATYEPIIDTVTFTTGDYATLPLFVTAESANSDYREYLSGTTAGATISGFSDGVIINGGTVTSPITLTQTGIAQIKNATCDDIDATGATGDVTIIDCEVEDVTG